MFVINIVAVVFVVVVVLVVIVALLLIVIVCGLAIVKRYTYDNSNDRENVYENALPFICICV